MKRFSLDAARLRPFVPVAPPVLVLVVGWVLLIGPAVSRNARTAREIDEVRQRLTLAHRAVSGPAPPAATGDPAAAFGRALSRHDATPQLLEQLARLAADAAQSTGLSIETGERVTVTAASAPQVADQAQPDPRLALFEAPLAFSPVTMAFDAGYAGVGTFLWNLRDLATVVEIRSFEMRTQGQTAASTEHVTLTLFAYARQPGAPAVVAASAEVGR